MQITLFKFKNFIIKIYIGKNKHQYVFEDNQKLFDKKYELISKEWDKLSEGEKKLILGLPVTHLNELGIK